MAINFGPEIFLAVTAGLALWLLLVSVFLIRTIRHYQRLGTGVEHGNLQKVLEKILKDVRSEQEMRKKLEESLAKLEKEAGFHFQKMGLMRYNPFSEAGGNQSFVLALLDKKDSGLVISSLHGRESTRIYAKPIKKGKGEVYELSKEEEEVIRKARKIK